MIVFLEKKSIIGLKNFIQMSRYTVYDYSDLPMTQDRKGETIYEFYQTTRERYSLMPF